MPTTTEQSFNLDDLCSSVLQDARAEKESSLEQRAAILRVEMTRVLRGEVKALLGRSDAAWCLVGEEQAALRFEVNGQWVLVTSGPVAGFGLLSIGQGLFVALVSTQTCAPFSTLLEFGHAVAELVFKAQEQQFMSSGLMNNMIVLPVDAIAAETSSSIIDDETTQPIAIEAVSPVNQGPVIEGEALPMIAGEPENSTPVQVSKDENGAVKVAIAPNT